MSEAIGSDEYIRLGHSLCIVANPRPWDARLVSEEIGRFLDQLTTCGMNRARIAAQPLAGRTIEYRVQSGFIENDSLSQLISCMESVVQTLYAEARDKQVVSINVGAVPQRLREVSQVLTLSTSQVQLLEETIRCLERGAYRAAIVMGWCLAYDIIRWWVYSDQKRLNSFNSELATYTKRNGTRQYEDIKDYEDFFSNRAPAEGRAIEICENAKLISGKSARNLRHYLDLRNDYAHATTTHPTPNQASAFLEHLVDIVTKAPYAK